MTIGEVFVASPLYPFKHSGPVIVAGNARCMHEDISRAREIYGDIPIIAVNGASREIKAQFLYSKHPERFVERGGYWIARQQAFHLKFEVHGSAYHENMPFVHYWWEAARGGGGSGWGGRKLATCLGFDKVILCGIPLVPGGYVRGISKLMNRQDVIDVFRHEIEADTSWHEGVISMSGWTKDLLSPAS